ncbi:HEPN domain-containing protein [bacterium]|nr:HEPN domain-containing protein [bacterium]
MPRHDSELISAVSQWVDKAEMDLRASRLVLDHDSSIVGVAAFHAQQAAEKYLKALLTWKQITFTKTHDIGLLLETLNRNGIALVEDLRKTIILSDFAVDSRYPGDIPELSNAEAEKIYQLALLVKHHIVPLLPPIITKA